MTRQVLPVLFALGLSLSVAGPAGAQLAAPGPSGVVMGHVHVVVRDLDAHRRFWTALGGRPTKNGQLEMIQFPGAFVNLRQGDSSGGSVGTSINHVGFLVKNMQDWMPKWRAAGLTMEPQTRPTQVFLIAPDEVRVEILEDATIDTPIKMHHVHFFVADTLAAQAWYAKTFGAVPGKRGQFDAADLPGVNLTFGKSETPTLKTQGRSLDHVGFEVKDLEQFVKKLEAGGIKLDRLYQRSQAAPAVTLAFITDPWGTSVELTEGLTPPAGSQ